VPLLESLCKELELDRVEGYQVAFKDMAQRVGRAAPKSITPERASHADVRVRGKRRRFELFVDDIQFPRMQK
jgi:hypothetical protein